MATTIRPRRIGIAAVAQFSGAGLQQVLKYLTNILIARGMGAAALGVYQLALTFWIAIQTALCGGFGRAIMRMVPHHMARDEKTRARGVVALGMNASWWLAVVLGAALYLAADFIAGVLLHTPEAGPVLEVLALALPLAALNNVVWALGRSLGSLRYVIYQFLLVPASFIIFIAAAVLYLAEPSAVHVAWAFLLSYALPLIAMAGYYRFLVRFSSVRLIAPVAGPFLAFAGATSLLSLAEFLCRNADVFILARFASAAEVGYYAMASRTATLCLMVTVSFDAFFAPAVSSLYSAGRIQELRGLFRRACGWILLAGAPLLAIIITNASDILSLFGAAFLSAIPALLVIAASQLLNLGTGLVGVVLLMTGRQVLVLALNVAALIVNVALCWWLIPQYSLLGAAIGTAGAVVFLNLTLMLCGYAYLRLNPFSESYLRALAAALIAGAVNYVFIVPLLRMGLPRLGAGIACVAIVYGVVIALLGGLAELSAAVSALRGTIRPSDI
jgi:O-antigen/teichoic acid export membrane protein